MSAIEPVRPKQALEQAAGSHMGLGARTALLILVLFVEKFGLNFFIDTQRADTTPGAAAVVRDVQHVGFRFAVPFALALTIFVLIGNDSTLDRVNSEARGTPWRAGWLTLHAVLLAALAASLTFWYRPGGIDLPLVGLSVALAAAAGIALLGGLAPLPLWRLGAAALGIRWLYATIAAAMASAMFTWSEQLWGSTAQVTFRLVRLLLAPILPSLRVDSVTRTLETPHFAIYVAPQCSGLEGVALMIIFSCAWLTYFRREYIFPRALLLIPAGVLVIFALNVVRIAALVLIGNAGFQAIALYGFHSQAGWIAFNCAACGIAVVSRHSSWLNRQAAQPAAVAAANPPATYLIPFLAILAAGMISSAISGGFETWYALRLIVAIPALVILRRPLARLDWRFGWRAIAVGAAVFALWLGAARWALAPHGMPAPLAAMPAGARDLWIATRALTAILVVPIAEELAYRGFLMRRLLAADFESVSFSAVGWIPLLVTAIAFGVVHGALWLPGIAAGVAYGLVLTRTGRMGEAVAAHATSNLLIAAWVLAAGQWQLW